MATLTSREFEETAKLIYKEYPKYSDLLILSGSHAYGTAHSDSDIDFRGIWVEPNRNLLCNISTKPETSFSVLNDHYDFTSHELNTFVHLMTKCNPNILEVACLGSQTVSARTPIVPNLEVSTRSTFTATNNLRDFIHEIFPLCLDIEKITNAYCGFAHGQVSRLRKSGDAKLKTPKSKKLARHALRVMLQAEDLFIWGSPTVSLGRTICEKLDDFGNCGSVDEVAEEIKRKCNNLRSDAATRNVHSSVLAGTEMGKIENLLCEFRVNANNPHMIPFYEVPEKNKTWLSRDQH